MSNAGLALAKLTTMREHTDRMERRRSSSLDLFQKDNDRQDARLPQFDRGSPGVGRHCAPHRVR